MSPGAGRFFTLRFPHLDREIPASGGETIYESARRGGVRIVGACGGRGSCGTCMVRVVAGKMDRRHGTKWVRACQLRPRSDCVLELAPRSTAPVVRSVEAGTGAESLEIAPAVVSRDVAVPQASLSDPRADADRLLGALAPLPVDRLDLSAARRLPQMLHRERGSLRARLRGSELIGVAATGSPALGLAVDLGTSNAAAFLVDLERGSCLASLGIENPQVAWGADVISRINHAIGSPEAAAELRTAAVAAINALAHDLCRAVHAKTEDIVDLVVCGNTAMQHLLLGLPVRQLGRAPFVAAVREALEVKARDLGLAICPGAYVHLAPTIGGFVGGDHVTALLATEDRWAKTTTSVVMDIGTNTEVSLYHRGELVSASCPSGPALEGGHISCGMRAAEGAIERVALRDGEIVIKVIGGTEPVGLCGSGVLDALATLRRCGAVSERGRIVAHHPLVREDHGKRAALLAPGVAFTQEDVRAVQLAKAAIRTCTEMLLEQAGIEAASIERFIIAGAFGAYLDVQSGVAIGLFPDLPAARFAQVGNAAGAGVRQMLASTRARRRAAQLACRCRYLELSTLPGFQKSFLNRIGFDPIHAARNPS